VIDDEETVRAVAARLLESLGFTPLALSMAVTECGSFANTRPPCESCFWISPCRT